MSLKRNSGAPRFDAQASDFDRRTGVRTDAARSIAAAVLATAAPLPGAVLLELGAGTGELGALLADGGVMPYVGVDLSLGMLARFHARSSSPASAGRRAAILQADADRPWPLAAGRARIVFVSRALHLLEVAHVAAEVRACAHPGGCTVVVGRVRRERDSVRSMLRRQMKGLLAARGITGRSGEDAASALHAALAVHGARTPAPRTVASWTAEERPSQVLAGWRGKPGLAGVAMPLDLQASVLHELETWARARFADLDAPHPTRDAYELTVIDLPGRSEGGAAL